MTWLPAALYTALHSPAHLDDISQRQQASIDGLALLQLVALHLSSGHPLAASQINQVQLPMRHLSCRAAGAAAASAVIQVTGNDVGRCAST